MADGSANRPRYVYGVVNAAGKDSIEVKGINDEPVVLVASNGIAALTSSVPDGDLEAGREELLTHSRVLEHALEDGTVLPMQFGVVMPSESSVRDDLLGAHEADLENQLAQFDDKVEINIKGIYEEAPVLQEVLDRDPEVASLREDIRGKPEEATYYERIRLGELVAAGLERLRADDSRAIVDRLLPCAEAVEVGEDIHERMAVNASFLVAREKLERFDRAIDSLGEEQAGRIRFKYRGPLPPHSFVELGMDA